MRVITYNVHGCVGTDGHLAPERIAEVIAQYSPDVVALQELDVRRRRSGHLDQARRLGALLQMESHFHPAFRVVDEEYGDAILSPLPLKLVKAGTLPTVRRPLVDETRGALWVEVDYHGHRVQVLNTHLGLGREERRVQTAALLGPEWIGAALQLGPVVMCGDLNSIPRRRVHTMFSGRLRDAQRVVHGRDHKTFATRWPFVCLDYVFVSEGVEVSRTEVPRTAATRLASDHFPLIADLAFRT
jgi:endonuclease/exonuclease/phosphatase family metal-dependent hydrolase